jgi:hypothetical protein
MGVIRLNRCVACLAPASNVMARSHEARDQLEPARHLGSHRHDSDVGAVCVDDGEDVVACEGSRRRRTGCRTNAVERLRSAVLRVDEIALEMRGKDARAARARRDTGVAHRREHRLELARCAGY